MQEQNALTKHAIQREASYWRAHNLTRLLTPFCIEKNIDINRVLLIDLHSCYQYPQQYEGILLTAEQRFYQIEVELDAAETKILTIYNWQDVTENITVNAHQRGTGASWGWLALEVWRETFDSERDT